MTDRPYRTARNDCFNGGYRGHGTILPMEPERRPSLFARAWARFQAALAALEKEQAA